MALICMNRSPGQPGSLVKAKTMFSPLREVSQ